LGGGEKNALGGGVDSGLHQLLQKKSKTQGGKRQTLALVGGGTKLQHYPERQGARSRTPREKRELKEGGKRPRFHHHRTLGSRKSGTLLAANGETGDTERTLVRNWYGGNPLEKKKGAAYLKEPSKGRKREKKNLKWWGDKISRI